MKIEIDNFAQDLLAPGALVEVKKALAKGLCDKCLTYNQEQKQAIRELIAYPDHTVVVGDTTYYASCNSQKFMIYLDITNKKGKHILLLFHTIGEWETFWAKFVKNF